MRTICVELDAAANALDLSPDNLQVVIAGRHGNIDDLFTTLF